jgi:hypothetical protein
MAYLLVSWIGSVASDNLAGVPGAASHGHTTRVVERGSQDFWCPQKNPIRGLFLAFRRPEPDPQLLMTSNASQKPARILYEALGISYSYVDVDGRSGTLIRDLNFDTAPEEHWNKYRLATNHGTSEHILNQQNVFKMMHDFTTPGGVMIHAVPFTVHLEHGFFNYQPNFFDHWHGIIRTKH